MAYNKRQREIDEFNKRMAREKAAGKKPVKKNVLNNNKETSKAFREDRPERLKAKVSSVFKDDAAITYDNKKFNKRKKTREGGNFAWDGELLKDLPTKKYGRSYADKFNKLAEENGIPHKDRAAFKDYLDAQEYGARSSYQNAEFENDRSVDRVKKKNEREQKAIAESKTPQGIANAEAKKKADRNPFQKALDFGKSLTAFDDTGFKRSRAETGGAKDGAERFASRSANSALLGLPAQIEKSVTGETAPYQTKREFGDGGGTDIISDLLGYLAPGVGIAKGVRGTSLGAKGLTKGISARNVGQLAKEGAAVGGIMSGIEVGGREALNPEDYNWKQNAGQIALETGAGAVLDPLISMIGPLARAGSEKSIKNVLNDKNLVDAMNKAAEGKVSDLASSDIFTKIMNESVDFQPRRNVEMAEGSSVMNNPLDTMLLNAPKEPNIKYGREAGPEPRFGLPEPLTVRTPSEPLGQNVNIEGTPRLDTPEQLSDMQQKLARWNNPNVARRMKMCKKCSKK